MNNGLSMFLSPFTPKIAVLILFTSYVGIKLHVVQFWFEILLVISNQTRAARPFDFEITQMISDQNALHSVQLPLFI